MKKNVKFYNNVFPGATYVPLSHSSVNDNLDVSIKKKHHWNLSRRETCDCNLLLNDLANVLITF